MAGTIKHSWNGTILTIESDSGTSSMDLKGGNGDIGPRGPQGPAGVIINPDGSINYNGYATEQYVDDKIEAVKLEPANLENYYTKAQTLALIPDTSGFVVEAELADYATKTYVNSKIPDTSGFATKTELNNYATKNELKNYATKDYVLEQISEIEISGGNVDIDLSDYALKTDIPDVSKFITMAQVEAKGYQTAAQVQTAINDALAALNGDEVSY